MVCVQVLGVQWKGDQLWGTIEVLPTPSGLLLWELYAQGIKLGVSSRGWASLRTDTRAKCVFVDDDFELITFDFVTEPSTKGAYLVPMSVPYKHPVPDQTKCVQTAFLGHGVVSMRNIPRLPSVYHLARRIKELQEEANDYHRLATGYQQPLDFAAPCHTGAPPLQPTASLAAARSGRGRSLDQLLLFCHYIVFPGAPYLDREEHARNFQAHVALFATRAHLADQEHFAQHRADLNAVILQEVVRQQTKRAASSQALQDPVLKPLNSSAVAVAAGVPTPSLAAPPQAVRYSSLEKRPQLPGQAAASAAAAAQAAACAVSAAATRSMDDPQLAGHANCKPVPISAGYGGVVGVIGKAEGGMQPSPGGSQNGQHYASRRNGKTNTSVWCQQQQQEGLASSPHVPALASSEAQISCQTSASLPAPQSPTSPLLHCPSLENSNAARTPYLMTFSAHPLGRPSATHAPEHQGHQGAADPTQPALVVNPATCAPLTPPPLNASEPLTPATTGSLKTYALPSSNSHLPPPLSSPLSPLCGSTQRQKRTLDPQQSSSTGSGGGGGVEGSHVPGNGSRHSREPAHAPHPHHSSSSPASVVYTLHQPRCSVSWCCVARVLLAVVCPSSHAGIPCSFCCALLAVSCATSHVGATCPSCCALVAVSCCGANFWLFLAVALCISCPAGTISKHQSIFASCPSCCGCAHLMPCMHTLLFLLRPFRYGAHHWPFLAVAVRIWCPPCTILEHQSVFNTCPSCCGCAHLMPCRCSLPFLLRPSLCGAIFWPFFTVAACISCPAGTSLKHQINFHLMPFLLWLCASHALQARSWSIRVFSLRKWFHDLGAPERNDLKHQREMILEHQREMILEHQRGMILELQSGMVVL
ncbi:hypothetical protein DUNSADRAFT_14464 [Dunaliella salina]|uniref:Uncharacterized protein n=1 Tax=Dunaliella salina TaxID=3046 RepID=A0ABQ7H9L5_DUNSA|nr:hypothetical protein DUNSADRAFT_14464 [Dunaliella salina]|eukprot:KAF5843548.1 hypothetical protein DUNSADRAFT_14464 [Dunaliella salina]